MKLIAPSKTAYERFLNDNPPLNDPLYLEYCASGGTCWGGHYRKHHAAQFNRDYEEVWTKRPDLWDSEPEL